MNRRRRQLLLGLVAGVCAIALIVTLTNRDLLRDPKAPEEPRAAWLNAHPADWLATSALADVSLDAQSPRRLELWRASYAHAKLLAPHRRNTDAGFVRAGLFHWYELNAGDRKRVVRAAGPLLRDPAFFSRMHGPLWQLTRDFAWLHANAPDTPDARAALRNLALSRGLFAEYRTLREELRQLRMKSFASQRRTADAQVLLNLVPERVDRDHEPLVRGILEELDRRAFEPQQLGYGLESLVDFAVRRDVRPLTGLLPLIESQSALRDVTRARAALDLDNPTVASRIELTSSVANAAEWQPYYLERARFEARRRDAMAANSYLRRAAADGMTTPVLAAAIDVARLLGKPQDEQRFRAQLAQTPRPWAGTCGTKEVCSSARTVEYAEGGTLRVALENAQSDEIAPYVEIYVDDARLAEGEVRDARTFTIAVAPGLHDVEVRLVNTHTRNGAQRRVRIS